MSAGFDGGQRLGISRELAQLSDDGGTIPDAVTAADNDYNRLVEQAAKVPGTSATRARLASQLVDGDVVKTAEFAELASLGDKETVYKMAIEEALHRYIAVAKAHSADIITEARRCWFTPSIDKLTATAVATSAGDTSDDLIRRGHVEAGTGIAMAKVELKAVQKAVQLQRRLANLPPNSVLTSWTNPDGTAEGLVSSGVLLVSRHLSGDFSKYLELDRSESAEGPLTALTVIGPLDPCHDREPQFFLRRPPPAVEDVLLQQREERLHGGVVTAGADPSHRPDKPVALQRPHEDLRTKLRPPIRVQNRADRSM